MSLLKHIHEWLPHFDTKRNKSTQRNPTSEIPSKTFDNEIKLTIMSKDKHAEETGEET